MRYTAVRYLASWSYKITLGDTQLVEGVTTTSNKTAVQSRLIYTKSSLIYTNKINVE